MMIYAAVMDSIQNAVNVDDMELARRICNDQIAMGNDLLFWRTQMAYIHFADDKNYETHYVCVDLFRDIVTDFPGDENALFWYGYTSFILFNHEVLKQECDSKVLQLNPTHLYANLTLARSATDDEQAIQYFERCLENNRSIPNAFDLLLSKLPIEDVRHQRYLEQLKRSRQSFLECSQGAMNHYINDVFIGFCKFWEISRKWTR